MLGGAQQVRGAEGVAAGEAQLMRQGGRVGGDLVEAGDGAQGRQGAKVSADIDAFSGEVWFSSGGRWRLAPVLLVTSIPVAEVTRLPRRCNPSTEVLGYKLRAM